MEGGPDGMCRRKGARKMIETTSNAPATSRVGPSDGLSAAGVAVDAMLAS